MKTLIAFLVAWVLYGAGELASKILEAGDSDRWCEFWYPIYNELMLASSRAQDWGNGANNRWPWGKV